MGWKDFNADILTQDKPSTNDVVRNYLLIGLMLVIAALGIVIKLSTNPVTSETFTIAFWISLGAFIMFLPVLHSKKPQPIGQFLAVENTITVTLFNEVPDNFQFNIKDVQKFKASIPNKPYTGVKYPWPRYKCTIHIKVDDRNFDLLLEYKGRNQQNNLLRLMEAWKKVLNNVSA
jgi:hypothetical protein